MDENLKPNNIEPQEPLGADKPQETINSPIEQAPEPVVAQAVVPQTVAPENFKLSPTFKLLGQAIKIFKSKFWRLLGLSVLPLVFVYIFLLLWVFLLTLVPYPFNLVLLFIVFLLPAFIGSASFVAMLYVVNDQENLSIMKALRVGFSKALSFIWVLILSTLLIMGGMLLLFVPGIILSFALTMSYYAFAIEGNKGLKALLRSSSMTKGHRGAILGRYFVFGISIVLPVMLVLIVGIPILIQSPETQKLAGGIVESVLSLFLTPISLIFGYLMFKELAQYRPIENFSPSSKSKKLYVFLAILGIVSLIIMMASPYIIMAWTIVMVSKTNPMINSDGLNNINLQNELSTQTTQPSESHKRDTQRINDIYTASIMLGSYFSTNGSYPVSLTISKTTDSDFVLRNTGPVVPSSEFNDPLAENGWYYGYISDGKTYTLTAHLENEGDKMSHYCDQQEKDASGLCIFKYTVKQ